jgi:hypothetical protein
LPFVERQFDDPRLHGLEAEHALMGFDVAGHHDGGRFAGGREPEQKGIIIPDRRGASGDQHECRREERELRPCGGNDFDPCTANGGAAATGRLSPGDFLDLGRRGRFDRYHGWSV